MGNQRKIFQWCDCRETDRKSLWRLLCLMVYPAGIYMPCEMVSVMIQ